MTMRIEQPPIPPGGQQSRKTEDTDTRQAIQHHDPEFYKKKKDDGDQPGFKDPYEDLADVSVPALKNFLLGLLDRAENVNPAPAPAPHTERPAATPQTAAAVNAYQAGAKRGVTPTPPQAPAVQPTDGTSALDQAAAGLDRNEVLDLIRELDRLMAEGIGAIAMEKGDGFLGSIRAGIARAREANS